MGTNFYAIYNKCEHCGRSESLHIGKRSGGWEFMFRAHEEPKLESAADWRKWLNEVGAEIRGDGEFYGIEDFWLEVERTRGKKNQTDYDLHRDLLVPGDDFKDAEGWAFHRGEFS